MMGSLSPAAESDGDSIASPYPRISRHRTRHGRTEAMSSTTNATRPSSFTLRYFLLAAML